MVTSTGGASFLLWLLCCGCVATAQEQQSTGNVGPQIHRVAETGKPDRNLLHQASGQVRLYRASSSDPVSSGRESTSSSQSEPRQDAKNVAVKSLGRASAGVNHPLIVANKEDVALSAQHSGSSSGPTSAVETNPTAVDLADAGAELPSTRRTTAAIDRHNAVSTETTNTVGTASSLGSRIVGGLRGHLLEQQKAKGLDPPKHPALHAARPELKKFQRPPSEVEGLPDEALQDDDPIANWWSGGGHWQPPVRPFVAKRPVKKPGSVAEGKSSIMDIASYLPGMRAKPSIPKIFHQVYLAGAEALAAAEREAEASLDRWPPVKAQWRQSCMELHPGWEFRLWNLSAMEDLLAQKYPWFLATFEAYPQLIHKVDAVRPFIMDAFGGVYIDVDVECLQPVDGFLEEHELVFQEEDFGQKSLVNSAMAGVPGHLFWHIWQQIMLERAPQLQKKRGIFSRSDYEVNAVLNATGPWALRAAFQKFSRDYGLLHTSYVGAWRINETNVMVYPLGTWFVPCLWDNRNCHSKVEALVQQKSIPVWLAGHHKNAGSWFKAAGFSRLASRWHAPLRWAVVGTAFAVCVWLLKRKRRREAVVLERPRLPFPGRQRLALKRRD